ncbi:MAG: glycosyltransferase family A protein [Actinomycetota bacterium]
MPESPRISTIVPVFDRSTRLLGEAIDSALAQTHPIDEIIVVDDGSAEPVGPWLADHYGGRVIALRQDNAGIGPARNLGLDRATGDLITFLDSDDLWLPDKTESQLRLLAAEPSLEAVYGKAEQFYDEETDDDYRARHPIMQDVIESWSTVSVMMRRPAIDRIGPFAPQSQSVDIDWQARARAVEVESTMIDQIVYRRRLHNSNMGLTRSEEGNPALLKALREHLHRQRAQD